ncbi:MAG: PQQ-like beta-propeller repeat protein [Gammaproteobacteria bacterium]|nr:PQQ-like beta-propeller repeat protein [Gammaproteobacteria bacterium]
MTRLAWSGWLALCFAATAASAALSPPLQPVWQLTADRGFYAPPTVVGEVVYATDVSGQVRAVNLADGQLRWSFRAGGSAPHRPRRGRRRRVLRLDRPAYPTLSI